MVDEEFKVLAINSTNTDLFWLLYCTLLCTGAVGCNPGDSYMSKHLLNWACNCTHFTMTKETPNKLYDFVSHRGWSSNGLILGNIGEYVVYHQQLGCNHEQGDTMSLMI